MENLIIRNIKEEDIPSVVKVQTRGWQEAYKGIVDQDFLNNLDNDFNRRVKHLQESYKENGFIVAELNKEIVGLCRYRFDNSRSYEIKDADCELCAIYIRPDLKNKGIGTKLFEHVKKDCKNKGKRKMFLWCLEDNYKSRQFYTKMGGQIISRQEVEIGNKKYSEVCFIYEI